jgi:hypothetical protein
MDSLERTLADIRSKAAELRDTFGDERARRSLRAVGLLPRSPRQADPRRAPAQRRPPPRPKNHHGSCRRRRPSAGAQSAGRDEAHPRGHWRVVVCGRAESASADGPAPLRQVAHGRRESCEAAEVGRRVMASVPSEVGHRAKRRTRSRALPRPAAGRIRKHSSSVTSSRSSGSNGPSNGHRICK